MSEEHGKVPWLVTLLAVLIMACIPLGIVMAISTENALWLWLSAACFIFFYAG